MAELYTIKPDAPGDEDYTTLQAAEDDNVGSMTGRGVVTFECYDGTADLGECHIALSWINTDSSNYLRIFVPLAERHDGTTSSDGAWIDQDSTTKAINVEDGVDYTRIEGLRIDNNGSAVPKSTIYVQNASHVLLDSNLSINSGHVNDYSIHFKHTLDQSGSIVRNNIIYGNGNIIGFYMDFQKSTNGTVSLSIFNNTIDDIQYGIYLSSSSSFGVATLNATVENNIVTNNTGGSFVSGIEAGTITGNNNCSEDDKADDWDGSGSIINQTPSDLFVTEGADHSLKAGSNALEAGKTIAGWDNDALHLESDDWRPQDTNWDMGALEKVGAGFPSENLDTEGEVLFFS